MSRSYQQYMAEVVDEIERTIELRRIRPILRKAAGHSYWGPPVASPSTSLAVAGGTTAPTDESTAAKDFKIDVKAEIHKINTKTEASTSINIPGTKPKDLVDNLANDAIETNPISKVDIVEFFPPVVKFTIGGGNDSNPEEDAEQKSSAAAEIIQVQVEKNQGYVREQPKMDLIINGFLVVGALLVIALLGFCIRQGVMASYN